MYRPQKGEQGEQGEQGERGDPCKECACMYRRHGEVMRYITSGGRRSLSQDGTTVIVATGDKCVFYLPEVTIVDIECDDYYYYPIVISIFVKDGMHTLLSRGDSNINSYGHEYDLSKRCLYKAISTPTGDWLVYSM